MAEKPKSIWDALKSDARRTGIGIINAASTIPRLVQSHMQEYQPGMSVQDMPQTMEVLPEAAATIVGTPGAAVPGVTLNSGIKLPKLTGGYRSNVNPSELPLINKAKDEVGTHFTTSPNVAAQDSGTLLGNIPNISGAGPRTMPVVADIRKPFEFPTSPTNWADPNSVLGPVKMGVEMGLPFPKGVLSGLESAAKQTGGLKENLIPYMKELGHDAIKYPRSPGDIRLPLHESNSYMAFNPGQVVPKLSPQGQHLIQERGIVEPPKNLMFDDATKFWANLPERMRAKIEDVLINDSLRTYSKEEQKEILKAMTRAKMGG